eukprot:31081-Pelagococcus_subviridis.AAC.9
MREHLHALKPVRREQELRATEAPREQTRRQKVVVRDDGDDPIVAERGADARRDVSRIPQRPADVPLVDHRVATRVRVRVRVRRGIGIARRRRERRGRVHARVRRIHPRRDPPRVVVFVVVVLPPVEPAQAFERPAEASHVRGGRRPVPALGLGRAERAAAADGDGDARRRLARRRLAAAAASSVFSATRGAGVDDEPLLERLRRVEVPARAIPPALDAAAAADPIVPVGANATRRDRPSVYASANSSRVIGVSCVVHAGDATWMITSGAGADEVALPPPPSSRAVATRSLAWFLTTAGSRSKRRRRGGVERRQGRS